MYSFKNDYSEGAHSNILQRLLVTNNIQQSGYGEDEYSLRAKLLLKEKIKNSAASIFFISGGTQTNLIVISSLLKIHEAVISAKTGHIYANETGAIESTGHRIIPVETPDGKLRPSMIHKILEEYALRPHVVKPKMVYISNSTEIGTIYSKSELKELSDYCKSYDLLLYMDGARLGHALTATDNDVTLADLSLFTDVFYVGGTKNGALLGEAVIFNQAQLAYEFDYVLKQKGALLAKGRILGIQFLELFQDDLYFSLAKHANVMAMKIAAAIEKKGYSFLTPSTTNQIFPILPLPVIQQLRQKYEFYIWKSINTDRAAIRLITSWATEEKQVDAFINDLHLLL